jgi:glycosyltransferase involved in cell wall biosynthesis
MTPAAPRPLQILHVVDSLEFGGLERVVSDLAMAQHSLGHGVVVFSINATEGLRPEVEAAGILVVIGGKSRSFDTHTMAMLRRTVAERRIDVVHTHSFVPNYYAACALLGMVRRPALVGTCHDMGNRLANRKLRWMYRLSLLRTRRVAMVGQQVHDRFVASGLVKAWAAETVLNGIPVQRFANSTARRQTARSRLNIAADVPVIGCVGRLVALKNQRLMLDAMPRLLRLHPDLRLVIVGDGPLDATLRAQALSLKVADHVDFLGPRIDVADLLPAFDIFALPSQTEGLSIALLEACATALAVVATQVGGNPEIIAHERTGLLVPPDDLQALGDALERLLADPALRSYLSTQACEWVRAHASIDALCTAYDRFYRRAQ